MTTHILDAAAFTPYLGDYHRSSLRLLVDGARADFAISWVPRDGVSRDETGGPMTPGPKLSAFGLATVIAPDGGSARERREAGAEGRLILAQVGDRFEIAGDAFRLDWHRSGAHVDRHNVRFLKEA